MNDLTISDLRFLVYNKVALRFQHSEYDDAMKQNGVINGDAYSLSDPAAWHPSDNQKLAEFQTALHKLAASAIFSQCAWAADGVFLLLKDVDGARNPVKDRLYEPPFYPVGAFTRFSEAQCVGRIPVSVEVIKQLGFDTRVVDHAAVEKVAAHFSDNIIKQIAAARLAAGDQELQIKQDAAEIDIERRNVILCNEILVAKGLQPIQFRGLPTRPTFSAERTHNAAPLSKNDKLK